MDELSRHYGTGRVIDRILTALADAGIDIEPLDRRHLAGADEFHLGGALSTRAILDDIDLADDACVLDVGSGIGGPARQIAAGSGRRVVGVDLTPDFVEAAAELTARTGLADQVDFRTGDATALPFDENEFDAVTMFHVGMNIDDKAGLFTELARVLRPGGTIAVFDIMVIGDGDLIYPLPWSSLPITSHLASPDVYAQALRAAGLEPDPPVDRRPLVAEALAAAAESPPAVNLSHVMGADWPTMFGNLRAALTAGVVAPIQILARHITTPS